MDTGGLTIIVWIVFGIMLAYTIKLLWNRRQEDALDNPASPRKIARQTLGVKERLRTRAGLITNRHLATAIEDDESAARAAIISKVRAEDARVREKQDAALS